MNPGATQIIATLIAALTAILGVAPACAAEPEQELKAATVLSFLRYSEWHAQAPGDNLLTVGVIGRPETVAVMRRVLDGKIASRRIVRVTELRSLTDSRCCDVLYFATDKLDVIRQGIGLSRGAPVLTIGESDRFLDSGGAVHLFLSDGRISFEVDLDALARSGVMVSATLLRFGQVRKRLPG
jgi:hypothetical protein